MTGYHEEEKGRGSSHTSRGTALAAPTILCCRHRSHERGGHAVYTALWECSEQKNMMHPPGV